MNDHEHACLHEEDWGKVKETVKTLSLDAETRGVRLWHVIAGVISVLGLVGAMLYSAAGGPTTALSQHSQSNAQLFSVQGDRITRVEDSVVDLTAEVNDNSRLLTENNQLLKEISHEVKRR